MVSLAVAVTSQGSSYLRQLSDWETNPLALLSAFDIWPTLRTYPEQLRPRRKWPHRIRNSFNSWEPKSRYLRERKNGSAKEGGRKHFWADCMGRGAWRRSIINEPVPRNQNPLRNAVSPGALTRQATAVIGREDIVVEFFIPKLTLGVFFFLLLGETRMTGVRLTES